MSSEEQEKRDEETSKCNCIDCLVGEESAILHDISPDDPSAENTQCILTGQGASTLLPCGPNQKVDMTSGSCITCLPTSEGVQTYGCPSYRGDGVPQPGDDNCIHDTPPGDITDLNYNGTVCRRPVCTEYQRLIRSTDGSSGYDCVQCEQDANGRQMTSSTTTTNGSPSFMVSPDLAMDDDTTECVTDTTDLLGYCQEAGSDIALNDEWNYQDYILWSETDYGSESNRSNWLPNHQYLRTVSDLNGFINKTNKDVYFYSPTGAIESKYKYSYLKSGKWIHLCECNSTSNKSNTKADKENGFTNCKCAQSQYLNDDNTCKNIESTCYGNGNYFNGKKMVEGEFWNIKDPYCNFFDSTADIDSPEIQGRCCVGCSHKVYKGGVPGNEHISANPPDYAINWYKTSGVGIDMGQLKYDTSDPILTPSPSAPQPRHPQLLHDYDWRKHDYSIGFNSRPALYYPSFDVTPQKMTGRGTSQYTAPNWDASKGSLEDCNNVSCSSVPKYRTMTSNIFTCKRTNPGESSNQSLSIPAFGVVGDEPYYGGITNAGPTNIRSTPFSDSNVNYVLEYPEKKMWVRKEDVITKVTPLETTVLSDKKIQLSNQQVSDGVSDVVSDGLFTVGDDDNDGYSLLYGGKMPRAGTFTNAGMPECAVKTMTEAENWCGEKDCHGFWRYSDTHSRADRRGRTCLKKGSKASDIEPYMTDSGGDVVGNTVMADKHIKEKYEELMVNDHPTVYSGAGRGPHADQIGDHRPGRHPGAWLMDRCISFDGADGRTNEQLINQCATYCSTERAVTGVASPPPPLWEPAKQALHKECTGFWIDLEGTNRGRCCPKSSYNEVPPTNRPDLKGKFFKLVERQPAAIAAAGRSPYCPSGWQGSNSGPVVPGSTPPASANCVCQPGSSYARHGNQKKWRCV